MAKAKITYRGPGNSWNVSVNRSVLTDKIEQIEDVRYKTACTFVKTHTIATWKNVADLLIEFLQD